MDALARCAAAAPITVTDHALWRAAERFGTISLDEIEHDVREALVAGRFAIDREPIGLAPHPDPESTYVWTEDLARAYVLRPNRYESGRSWIVATVLIPHGPRASSTLTNGPVTRTRRT